MEHSESDDEREISCEDIGDMETVDEVCDDDVLPDGIEDHSWEEEEDTDKDVDEGEDHNKDDDPDEVGDADEDEEVEHHLVSI